MYRYETHLHTYPVSRCAKATVEESLDFYKSLGYDGVFITNHFINGNINLNQELPYEKKLEFYFSDYEKGVEIGRKMGIKVFCGVEFSYKGTDFLIYGLEKEWFLRHPEIEGMKTSQALALFMEHGALVIQAHPFREAAYIDHIRLFPRHIQGVEVLNAGRTAEENAMAKQFAQHYSLLEFAGSDNHLASAQRHLAGIQCARPIETVQDWVARVKQNETEIFSQIYETFPWEAQE